MTQMLNAFDDWFVGIRGDIESGETLPLAFVTQNTNDAAFKKREETVRSWAAGRYAKKPAIFKDIKNTPTEGFVIVDFESRHVTSNKVFRVSDPRGWLFEIYADNLVHLIQTCTLEKGIIKAPIIYAKKDANIYLTHPTDPRLFDPRGQKSIAAKDLLLGDMILQQKQRLIYVGSYDLVAFKRETIRHNRYKDSWHGSGEKIRTNGQISATGIPSNIYATLVSQNSFGGDVFRPVFAVGQMFISADDESNTVEHIASKRLNLLSRGNAFDFDASSKWDISYSTKEDYFVKTVFAKNIDLAAMTKAEAFNLVPNYYQNKAQYLYHDENCIVFQQTENSYW